MDIAKLSVRKREATGRGSSRRLRKSDEIPAVVYGRSGNQPLSISVKAFHALWKKMGGGASLIEIADEQGETRLTTIKDIQKDPIKDHVLHIDFNEVYMGEAMTASVPFHTHGTPSGVKNDGGILESSVHELEVRCLPKDFPDHLEVDVSELEIGDSLHVSDMKLPAGVEVTDDPDTVLAYVAAPITEEELEELETVEEVAADAVPTTRDEEEAAEEAEGAEDSGEDEQGEKKSE